MDNILKNAKILLNAFEEASMDEWIIETIKCYRWKD